MGKGEIHLLTVFSGFVGIKYYLMFAQPQTTTSNCSFRVMITLRKYPINFYILLLQMERKLPSSKKTVSDDLYED